MVKFGNKHISTKKLILVCLCIIVGVPILYIGGSLAISPILDEIDKSRISIFESQTKAIMRDLQNKAGNTTTFTHELKCSSIEYGVFSSNEQICVSTIETSLPAGTPQQAFSLHEKFFPVVDTSPKLKPISDLSNQPSNLFGVKMIVSGVEKEYKSESTNASCSYNAELLHSNSTDVDPYLFNHFGAPISSGNGKFVIYLRCETKARDNWIAK